MALSQEWRNCRAREIVGAGLLNRLSCPQPSKEFEIPDSEVVIATVIRISLANPNIAIELGRRRVAGKVSRLIRAIQFVR
jgi:hypothetical protein